MEIMIELTEEELGLVAGGAGSASFSFTNTASGTTATVSGTLTQETTASSAKQSGSFSSIFASVTDLAAQPMHG
jgi:hypothetical protein